MRRAQEASELLGRKLHIEAGVTKGLPLTLFDREAKRGIGCRLDQALTEFKRSISVIGCCGDS